MAKEVDYMDSSLYEYDKNDGKTDVDASMDASSEDKSILLIKGWFFGYRDLTE